MKIIEHPDEFKHGTRILLRIARSKDRPTDAPSTLHMDAGGVGEGEDNVSKGEENKKGHATKRISESIEGYEQALSELCQAAQEGDRIYASVNARSIEKAIRLFKERQLDADYGDGPGLTRFYLGLRVQFISCLQNPQARLQSLFLFDCDSFGDYSNLIEALPGPGIGSVGVHTYRTKNGWHVITRPFNYTTLPQELHKLLKKDAMLLLAY